MIRVFVLAILFIAFYVGLWALGEECPDPEFKVLQSDSDGIILQYITPREYHQGYVSRFTIDPGWYSGGNKAIKHFPTYAEFETYAITTLRDKYQTTTKQKKLLDDYAEGFQERLDKHIEETKEKLEQLGKTLKGGK